MLELRLPTDAKGIATLGEAIRRECRRARATPEHAEAVMFVAAGLVGGDDGGARRGGGRRRERAPEVLVIVTVQSDATLLMVRDARPADRALGEGRRGLLDAHTARWSTMSGLDGRTIWTEIGRRAPAPSPVPEPRPALTFAD
jgi:hypothetical protein